MLYLRFITTDIPHIYILALFHQGKLQQKISVQGFKKTENLRIYFGSKIAVMQSDC